MVCPRCIDAVSKVFRDLQIETIEITLGQVKVLHQLNEVSLNEVKISLYEQGFELLEDHECQLVNAIKTTIIDHVHNGSEELKVNFSIYLSDLLKKDYSSLSRLFSSKEGITIERFLMKQKIERVKELLFYGEMTLSEIAYHQHYSSTAHLSAQFKKETGITPTAFKKLQKPGHQPLDGI